MASRRSPVGAPAADLAPRIRAALVQLFEAYRYAQDVHRDVWDFAIEIARLSALGLTPSDLRWLVCKGYVEHAREVTQPGEDGRAFRPGGNLTFCRRSCFVLTERGLGYVAGGGLRAFSRDPKDGSGNFPSARAGDIGPNGQNDGRSVLGNHKPVWDGEHKELRVAQWIVKRFRWRAPNQELLLAVFEEEGWPHRIDDPLPRVPEQDPRRRLHDTIKCLNRNQENRLIRFHGDGSGEGVLWELLETALRTRR
jgi:hypothetical protein